MDEKPEAPDLRVIMAAKRAECVARLGDMHMQRARLLAELESLEPLIAHLETDINAIDKVRGLL